MRVAVGVPGRGAPGFRPSRLTELPASSSTAATSEPSRIAPATARCRRERPVVAEPRGERPDEASRAHALRSRLERREELDPLRAREQLDRQRPLGVREHLPGLQPGRVPHRDVILLARARRDRVDARRVGEHLVLADQRRGHVLRDHEPGVEPAVGGQERRQTARQARVDEPLDPALGDVRELGRRPSPARRARTRAAGRGSSRSRRACSSSTSTSGLSVAAFSSTETV